MGKILESLKIAIPLPFSFLSYLKTLSLKLNIEHNYSPKNSALILSAFGGSLIFCSFLWPHLMKIWPLDFDALNSINSLGVVQFFIYNAIPLSVAYSIIFYIAIFKKDRKLINLWAFFVQGIKFFTVANIAIALIMLYATSELITSGLNIFLNQASLSLSLNSNKSAIILKASLFLLVMCVILILLIPTYKFLSNLYSETKFIYKVFILIAIMVSSSTLNNIAFSSFDSYPKISAKNLLVADKFCKDISELKMIQNKQCEVNTSQVVEFRENCVNLLRN